MHPGTEDGAGVILPLRPKGWSPRMKIRILYFEGCPNHPPIVAMADRLVAEHQLSTQVEEIEVGPDDVVALRFLGSPTVQVDGVDIEPAARHRTDFAMSCRVYDTPDGRPSEPMLREALGLSVLAGAQYDAPLSEPPSIDRAGLAALYRRPACWASS